MPKNHDPNNTYQSAQIITKNNISSQPNIISIIHISHMIRTNIIQGLMISNAFIGHEHM
jgi:hypothetical protein